MKELIVLGLVISTFLVSAAAAPPTPLRSQLFDRVINMLPQQANNAPLTPFITTTIDPRSRYTGTAYIAFSAQNQLRPSTLALKSYGLNVDGFPSQNDITSVLAGTNLALTQAVNPVANKNWILYDFDPQNMLPLGNTPLIAYTIGRDGIPKTADDLGIFPVAIDHVPGQSLKDIDNQMMIYTFLMPDINGTGQVTSDIILHSMGRNGRPDSDDLVTLVSHLQGVDVASEVRVSKDKFSVLFVGGRLDFYDLGPNNLYEQQGGDDSWISFSTGNPAVAEHDLSGRYLAYIHSNPPNPTTFVSVYDIGPDNRLGTADDTNSLVFLGTTLPRVSDGITSARLAFVGALGNASVIYLINAGPDRSFGTTDDSRQVIPVSSTVTSLSIEEDTLVWEDNTGIKFFRTSR